MAAAVSREPLVNREAAAAVSVTKRLTAVLNKYARILRSKNNPDRQRIHDAPAYPGFNR
jgi:hypothetical protein